MCSMHKLHLFSYSCVITGICGCVLHSQCSPKSLKKIVDIQLLIALLCVELQRERGGKASEGKQSEVHKRVSDVFQQHLASTLAPPPGR